MKTINKILLIGFILLILVGLMSIYTVREDEVAVVRVVGDIKSVIVDKDSSLEDVFIHDGKEIKVIKRKGLFFKWPLITSVDSHTSKLLTYISQEERVNTADTRQYKVKMFSQYEIINPAFFDMKFGSKEKANRVLDSDVYPIVIERINKLKSDDFLTDKALLYKNFEEGIVEINKLVKNYGIEVVDVDIYRTRLPESNLASTYSKMNEERDAEAQKLTSEGQEELNKIKNAVNEEAAQLKSEAERFAKNLKGKADAEAVEIYANGFLNEDGVKIYGYSVDKGFFKVYRTIEALENGIDENTNIYIDSNYPLFKNLE